MFIAGTASRYSATPMATLIHTMLKALLITGWIRQDKTVQIQPRWGDRVTITFTKRGTVPLLPAESHTGVEGGKHSWHGGP